MTSLFGVCGATASFIGLSLAMPKHFSQVWQRKPSERERVALRVLGWVGLTATILQCIAARGAGLGLVLSCGVLTLAGWAVALLLQYRPTLLPVLALVAGGSALAASAWLLFA